MHKPITLQRAPYGDLFMYWDSERDAMLWRREVKKQATRFERRQAASFIAEGMSDFENDKNIGPRFYKARKNRQTDSLVSINAYTGDRYYSTEIESGRFRASDSLIDALLWLEQALSFSRDDAA